MKKIISIFWSILTFPIWGLSCIIFFITGRTIPRWFGNFSILFNKKIEVDNPTWNFCIEQYLHFFKKENVTYSKSFEKNVLFSHSNVEEKRLPKFFLARFKIAKENISDSKIMEEFSIEKSGMLTREEIVCILVYLMSDDSDGKGLGGMINESYSVISKESLSIIGYLLCEDGVIRVVCMKCTWNLYSFDCCDIGDTHYYDKGDFLFRKIFPKK